MIGLGRAKQASLLLILCVSILLAFTTDVAEAKKYVTYHSGNHNGIWANISTPSSAGTGQSHHVSNYCCAWMQAGWRYHSGYSIPKRYWEYKDSSGGYDVLNIGSHNWNATVKYEISYNGGTTWCAWVAGVKVKCKSNIRGSNQGVITETEMHNESASTNTTFSYVRWKDTASGVWRYPNISSVAQQWPYRATITSGDSYYVDRGGPRASK